MTLDKEICTLTGKLPSTDAVQSNAKTEGLSEQCERTSLYLAEVTLKC